LIHPLSLENRQMVDNAIKLDEPYVRHIMSGTSCPAHLLQYDPSRAAISLFALRPAKQVFAERAGRAYASLSTMKAYFHGARGFTGQLPIP
jgi:hypothetical protein